MDSRRLHPKFPIGRRIRMGVRPKALLTELSPGFPFMPGLCTPSSYIFPSQLGIEVQLFEFQA